MRKFFEDIAAVARAVARERGDFLFFGVFHRSTTIDRWDVVVSAPWLDPDDIGDLRFLISRLQGSLPKDEFLRIALTIILPADSPVIQGLLASDELEPDRLRPMFLPAGPVEFDRGYLIERHPELSQRRKATRNSRASSPRAGRATKPRSEGHPATMNGGNGGRRKKVS